MRVTRRKQLVAKNAKAKQRKLRTLQVRRGLDANVVHALLRNLSILTTVSKKPHVRLEVVVVVAVAKGEVVAKDEVVAKAVVVAVVNSVVVDEEGSVESIVVAAVDNVESLLPLLSTTMPLSQVSEANKLITKP